MAVPVVGEGEVEGKNGKSVLREEVKDFAGTLVGLELVDVLEVCTALELLREAELRVDVLDKALDVTV